MNLNYYDKTYRRKKASLLKCKLTTQEKLKDLRNEKGLSLEELAKETGLSKSAIGSYESDDTKEITSSAIVTLAKYYGVSTDYLLGFTDNREQHSSDIDSIGLDDDTVAELQRGNLNVRLICEMIKHPEFANFLSDLEIYVDNLAGMQIHNMNTFIEHARIQVQSKHNISDSDQYMKTLEKAKIIDDDYFGNLLNTDIRKIAKDIKDAHKKDSDTGNTTNAVDDVLGAFEEMKSASDPTQAQLAMYSKIFKINFKKMDPYELKTFTDILNRYSDAFKPAKGNGTGKKRK